MIAQPRKFFAHQIRAFQYAEKKPRIALFMEMRLGKTLVAIRWARAHRLDRVLVVAPLSVLGGWVDELLAEGVPMGYINFLSGPTIERARVAEEIDTGWALVNYEAVRAAPQILDLPWSGLILDESTKIRNPQAKITKLMVRKTGHIEHRAILSGLPAPESPLDYYPQMQFVWGEFMDCYNYWHFRETFFRPSLRQSWEWVPRGDALVRIKHEVHRRAFVLTRKSAGIGEQKIYERRTVLMTREQRTAYTQVMKSFKFNDMETMWATTRQLWLARIAGGFSPDQEHPQLISDTKLMELLELVTGELRDEPVIVWYRFNEELRASSMLLTDQKIDHRCITGETPVHDRRFFVSGFQQGLFNVLLMQVKCGKFGLNVSRASTAIYYSNSYDMEDRAQSEDRIVHPSKNEPLLYIDLVTQHTVDEAVALALKEKHLTSRQFMTRILTDLRAQWDTIIKHPDWVKKGPPSYTQSHRKRWDHVYPSDRRF